MEETVALCITEHEGFSAVCLNRWVLQTAYYFQYRQQYGIILRKQSFTSNECQAIHIHVFKIVKYVCLIIKGNIDSLPIAN